MKAYEGVQLLSILYFGSHLQYLLRHAASCGLVGYPIILLVRK